MFEINEGDLPFVRTRQALLIIDLQNDLVSTGCILPVTQPPELVERILHLAPTFRRGGKVLWIRTQYEVNRPINTPSPDAERVITDKELPKGIAESSTSSSEEHGPRRVPRMMPKNMRELYGKIMAESSREGTNLNPRDVDDDNDEIEEPYDNETFLTLEDGKPPRCLIPKTLGVEFTQIVSETIDASKDTVFSKSHYSAFKSGTLLQTLRTQFVTELFICGALTNISIFATVMDAARFGFQITLVEDCLGYRSKPRHDEAMRQLIEAAGCEIIQSSEIIDNIISKEAAAQKRPTVRKRVRDTQDHRTLHQMMGGLKLKNEAGTLGGSNGRPSSQHSTKSQSSLADVSVANGSEKLIPRDLQDDEPLDLPLQLPKKPETEHKKRVPNKIKTRRRRPDPAIDDPNKLGENLKKDAGKDAKNAPQISPTHITLSAAAEALEKSLTPLLPDKSTDAEAVLTASISKEPDLGSSLTVGSPVKNSRVSENAPGKTKGKGVDRTTHQDTSYVHTTQQPSLKLSDPATIFTNGKEKEIEIVTSAQKTSVTTGEETKTTQTSTEYPSSAEDFYPICDGDSMIIHNLLPKREAENIFERVRDEIRWQKMCHQGGEVPRLVAVQGEISKDGSVPIYRHPADESPPLLAFSPTVLTIKAEVEKRLGHTVNHCLIQFYRTGTDYISEHSDKTLDIAPNTFIANVSLGAMRAMTFRTKRLLGSQGPNTVDEVIPRTSCKAPLPHNSLCKMSLITNEKWLHSIRPDKRAEREKSEAELAYEGGRISLTFRLIATFLDKDNIRIWGQGAVAKHKNNARPVVNGDTRVAEEMIRAFGHENSSTVFDWKTVYGIGFDVLHISNSRKLFLSSDPVVDTRVKIALAARRIEWVEGKLSPPFNWKDGNHSIDVAEVPGTLPIRFIDNDLARSQVEGDIAILLYLNSTEERSPLCTNPPLHSARKFTRLQQAELLFQRWRADLDKVKNDSLRRTLLQWEDYAKDDHFLAGPGPSIVDYAFWPLLHEIVKRNTIETLDLDSPNLLSYYERMLGLEAVRKVVEGMPGRWLESGTT